MIRQDTGGVFDVTGSIWTGNANCLSALNLPFWAKLTAYDAGTKYYNWEEVIPEMTETFLIKVGGRFGSKTQNPVYTPNMEVLTIPSYAFLQRAYFDNTTLDWVYVVIGTASTGGAGTLEDKLSDGSYDHINTTVQTFYQPDFLLSNSFGDVSVIKRNLYCTAALNPSTQSIANTTFTNLTWSSGLDFAGFVVNATDFIFPQEGLYFIRLQVYWENGTGNRVCQILDVPNVIAGNTNVAVGGGFAHQHECSALISNPAGATIRARVYQDSGGALNVSSPGIDYFNTNLTIVRLGGYLG
jgi:hypothetical protein